MKRALIVTLEISDPSELPHLAEEVANELNSMGLSVVSVKTWDQADPTAQGQFNSQVAPQ